MKNIYSLLLTMILTCVSAVTVAQQMPELVKGVELVTAQININQASVDDFISLKGVGLKRAQAIIAYREMNGKFTAIDDLLKVKGIGSKVLKDNKQRLKI